MFWAADVVGVAERPLAPWLHPARMTTASNAQPTRRAPCLGAWRGSPFAEAGDLVRPPARTRRRPWNDPCGLDPSVIAGSSPRPRLARTTQPKCNEGSATALRGKVGFRSRGVVLRAGANREGTAAADRLEQIEGRRRKDRRSPEERSKVAGGKEGGMTRKPVHKGIGGHPALMRIVMIGRHPRIEPSDPVATTYGQPGDPLDGSLGDGNDRVGRCAAVRPPSTVSKSCVPNAGEPTS
jgi:hypothetical protein